MIRVKLIIDGLLNMNEAMTQGVELMLVGMGIVFLFLVMLIVAVNAIAALVTKYFPEAEVQPANATPRPAPQSAGTSGTTAAITAAVHQYKAKHK